MIWFCAIFFAKEAACTVPWYLREKWIPKFHFFTDAMYAPALLTDVPEGAQVLAWQVAPFFEKKWDGFHAYFYNPLLKTNGAPAALHMGQVSHISFRVFEAYSKYAYPAHRELVGLCIR